jgi:importin subunit alpha-6/7
LRPGAQITDTGDGGMGGAGGGADGGLVRKGTTVDEIPSMLAMLRSDDPKLRLDIVTAFRKMLSKEDMPPIDIIVSAGLVPVLVRFLSFHTLPRLQFESAWALTNIASGTSINTRTVAESGAVEACVAMLSSPDQDVKEQAVWLLGNVAGESSPPPCHVAVHPAAAHAAGARHPLTPPTDPPPRCRPHRRCVTCACVRA